MLTPAPALVLAAAGLQDPGNAGAIIRSAAAAGATGVVLDELSADPWGWKALRASMGSAFHLPVVRSRAHRRARRQTGERRCPHRRDRAARRRSRCTTWTSRGRSAVLLGGEGAGLPDDLVDAADTRVSIPMQRRHRIAQRRRGGGRTVCTKRGGSATPAQPDCPKR